MNRDEPGSGPSQIEPVADDRLDSWKEIATYLKRDVRTVHRWETEEGLPVRRHLHKKRGSVYAYKAELEAWWNARQPRIEAAESTRRLAGSPRRRAGVVVFALVLLAFLVAAAYFARPQIWPSRRPPTGKVTLVVLPFENSGGDAEQEYFSDGLTEEMITVLGSLQPERLGVIARASTMRYKGSGKGIDQIARELGVDYVLESGVRRWNGSVRITSRLIYARDQTQVWAQNYERELRDTLRLQSEIAQAISREISLQLSPERQLRLAGPPQISPEAYEAYLKGLYFFSKFTPAGVEKSLEYLQRAIELEPRYAVAHARLARAYGLLGNFSSLRPEEAYPRQEEAARRALELDPTLDESHCALGWTGLFYRRDWPGARSRFQQAIELNPNSAIAHQGLAAYYVAMGQFDQALTSILRAQKLDPVNLNIKADVGWYLFFARRTDESIAQLQHVLEMDPNFSIAHLDLAYAYGQKGRFDEAIAEYQNHIRLFGGDGGRTALLGYAFASAGRKSEALEVLSRIKAMSRDHFQSPYNIALVYAAMGHTDEAFHWLEKAFEERFWMMAFLKVDPRWDPLRSDPRFADLLQRMAFPA